MGLFTSFPPPEPEPKEPPIRQFFNILAVVIAIFGFGLDIAGTQPYIGILFMVAALVYGSWESFTSKVVINRFPTPVRVLFIALLAGCIAWLSWPHLIAVNSASPPSGSYDADIKMPNGGWMTYWGSAPPNLIHVEANVAPIVPYGNQFRILLVIREVDNSVDEMEDRTIEKSSLFSITRDRMVMEMPMSDRLMFRVLPHNMVHVALVLLKAGTNPDAINKLSDVERLGGNILAINGFLPSIKTRLMPLKPLARPAGL